MQENGNPHIYTSLHMGSTISLLFKAYRRIIKSEYPFIPESKVKIPSGDSEARQGKATRRGKPPSRQKKLGKLCKYIPCE